jgi:hypothetical protein
MPGRIQRRGDDARFVLCLWISDDFCDVQRPVTGPLNGRLDSAPPSWSTSLLVRRFGIVVLSAGVDHVQC